VAPPFLLATPAAALSINTQGATKLHFRIHPRPYGRAFCGGGLIPTILNEPCHIHESAVCSEQPSFQAMQFVIQYF